MSKRSLRKCTFALAAIALAAVSNGPSRAAAQTPTIYYACYVPLTGTVYRIKETNLKPACTSTSHVEFSWNAQGPAGPAGQDGAPGAPGAPGPQGPAGGVSGWEMASTAVFTVAAGQSGGRSLQCPGGKYPLGGGAFGSAPITIMGTGPFSAFGGSFRGWTAFVFNQSSAAIDVTVYAICANAS